MPGAPSRRCGNTFPRVGAPAAPILDLQLSPNGRYLQLSGGTPFPIYLESSWEHARLQQAGWREYLDSMAARGYTAVLNQGPLSLAFDPGDDYGNPYFNATVSAGVYDITQPNTAAFANVKAALRYADSRGIVSFFFPAYTGFSGTQEGILSAVQAATGAQCEAYGAYIGSLIASIPGVIVALGGDDIPGASDIEKYRRICVGIKSTDRAGRLYTWHGARGESSFDLDATTAGYVASLGVTLLDWGYAREAGSPLALTHNQVLNSYAAPHPVFLGEGYYENSTQTNADALMLRRQFWGSWLSGALGHAFGDSQRYEFQSGWQDTLARAGLAQDVSSIKFHRAREWWKLVPSTGTGLVTSGGGTVNTTGYKPRAIASDGSFFLLHNTDGSGTTIDQGLLASTFDLDWVDPITFNLTSIAAGISPTGTRVCTVPGTNSLGQTDWLLWGRRNP